jgi:hypothetical protein
MRPIATSRHVKNYERHKLHDFKIKRDTNYTISCLFLGIDLAAPRMARPRWIVPWANSETKPAIYHCIARVVDRRFTFLADDKEQLRIYMRMMENFSGCRVLAYCITNYERHK